MGKIIYALKGWNDYEIEIFFETRSFLSQHFNNHISEQDIEKYFSIIKNKFTRINDLDKQWVACEQQHEKTTVVEAIEKISRVELFVGTITKETISKNVELVCRLMADKGITKKPRIAFYIMVMHLNNK